MITMFKISLYSLLMIIVLGGLNACSGGNEKKEMTSSQQVKNLLLLRFQLFRQALSRHFSKRGGRSCSNS